MTIGYQDVEDITEEEGGRVEKAEDKKEKK
jgi:hypothetical protein